MSFSPYIEEKIDFFELDSLFIQQGKEKGLLAVFKLVMTANITLLNNDMDQLNTRENIDMVRKDVVALGLEIEAIRLNQDLSEKIILANNGASIVEIQDHLEQAKNSLFLATDMLDLINTPDFKWTIKKIQTEKKMFYDCISDSKNSIKEALDQITIELE